GLAMNLGFAGPFRRRKSSDQTQQAETGYAAVTVPQPFWSRVRDSLGWLWGNGWSGVLLFAVMAVILGTLFATNSWDFPTFAGICGGAALIGLLIATARRTEAPELERRSIPEMFVAW